MIVVRPNTPHPTVISQSIFLAGPTPRDPETPSWRVDALNYLEKIGYKGAVFVPEPFSFAYKEQVLWEEEGLNRADVIVFWIPRHLVTMQGLTTNDEWGRWKESGKVVLGYPIEAQRCSYQGFYAEKLNIKKFSTLEETLNEAVNIIGEGAERKNGEATIPLHIWTTESFQSWYKSLLSAGNTLFSGRQVYNFRVGPKNDILFLWILHVNVYITAENRVKSNEIVVGRPDISSVFMYFLDQGKKTKLEDVKVVCVQEFRSGCSNNSGFVLELPGGSDLTERDFKTIAQHEVKEETGLEIDPARLKLSETRQLYSTLLSHKSHLYHIELSPHEFEWVQKQSESRTTFGVSKDTERTYLVIKTVGELLNCTDIDWSNLGMILSIVNSVLFSSKF
eukprot:TRINITY_DN4111_c0_g3_i1.p1 TRINITY_DN4111_c0_g3~~TRINITY_DN4111_c0_g3_i1.p1  ORF type:complete len:392 (-),score=76.88 TRINITY_DN4111_c0_g3_i1:97-1272(-)